MILYLYTGTLKTMNASSWKKAADIVTKMTPVTQQASPAATVELHNLQSLHLSTLSIDDSARFFCLQFGGVGSRSFVGISFVCI